MVASMLNTSWKAGGGSYRSGYTRVPRNILSDNSGFSFIDLMLALVVLTIGVLAMMDLQVIATRSNASSQGTETALTIAESKMEQIKDQVFTSIVSEAPTPVTMSNITFTRQVTVTNDTPIAGSKTVTVTVTWSDAAGKTHTIPMATVIAAPL
jgi:type IV pilus assembly protein PilV